MPGAEIAAGPFRVAAKDPLAEGVVLLTLVREDGAPVPEWEPGAHISIQATPELVREYSLCGDPADRTRLVVAVQREAEGRGGSRYIVDDLGVGARVEVPFLRNNFPLVEADSYRFVAGGIGITPMVAMIESVRAAGKPWSLHYGGRSPGSMAFASDLAARYGDAVELVPQSESGLLNLPRILEGVDERTAVYCCGPEGLLVAMEEQCRPLPATLHVERFTPRSDIDTSADGEFEVEVASSGERYLVPDGVSIVEILEDNGVEVDVSCEQGTCGTCETGVLEGIPDHRDSLLTEDERASNKKMMICVGRARSSRLVLDL